MTQFLIRCFIKHPEDTASPAVRTAYGNLASVVGMACNLQMCIRDSPAPDHPAGLYMPPAPGPDAGQNIHL